MTVVRWWPLVGLAGLTALGLVVGRGSTPLDDRFKHLGAAHPVLDDLLFFSDPRLLVALWSIALIVAGFRRRWRLSAVIAVLPLIAVVAARVCKRLFGRYSGDTLAYPSGHTTLAVVVLGLAVWVAGAAVWAFALAMAATVLAALGQSVTYHYFTDTVGALFLGTSLLCLAARPAKLDRCQPRCDPDHSSG
jgi:hypothetical protein